MTFFPHSFHAPLSRHGVDRARKLWYTVLFLPPELVAELPFDHHPQLRVEGEIADLPYSGAFISAGEGRRYCIVSPRLCRTAGLAPGDSVTMRFMLADQDAVDVPGTMTHALAGDADASAAWDALTPGRRRALAYHVAAAKKPETAARRVAAVVAGITGRDAGPMVAADVARLSRVLPK